MEVRKSLVGVFDSGVGGMSVLSAIRHRMPNLDIIYIGDNARAPYGNLTEEEVKKYTKEILHTLKQAGCTHFVSACNSISALVTKEILDELSILPTQYIDMVQPTKKYIANANIGRLLVLATVLTTKSCVYETHLAPYVTWYVGVGEKDLARQIEFNEGEYTIRKTIASFLETQQAQPQTTLLLSCTHYPLVRHIFDEEIHKRDLPIEVVDPALYVATDLELILDDTEGSGSINICMTKKSDTMQKLAKELGVDGYTIVSL